MVKTTYEAHVGSGWVFLVLAVAIKRECRDNGREWASL